MEPNYNHFYNIQEPTVYTRPPEDTFGHESWWQRVLRLVKEHFVLIALIVLISIGAFLSILNIYRTSKVYQKPDAWVISQGLNSTLTKQQLLLNSVKGGKLALSDIAKVATASTTIKAEAVKIGKDYLLSTGADGKVEIPIDNGQYRVEISRLEKIDFTGIPRSIIIERGNYLLNVGLLKGSGKIRAEGGKLKMEDGQSAQTNLQIALFSDKNGDGKKDAGEPDLPWAGITIKLVRI